jgi:hypothetical protein
VTIQDCDAFDINDGKGGDNGDGDGFHTDQYVDVLTLRNLVAYRISEDGIDTKAQTVTMENLVSSQNGATGIKMWGGGQGRTSTYTAKRILSWGNRETGVKCTGWLDTVTAKVDNSTFWANGEDAFKNTNGVDNSNDCIVTLRNSILGATRDADLRYYAPRTGYTGTTNLDHTDIYTTAAGGLAISPSGCSPLSSKYTAAQYLAGTYNTDLSGGYVCGGAFGTIFGTSTAPMIASPAMGDPPEPFEWEVISQTSVAGGTVQLVDPVVENSYPWPNPVAGHFVEINFDGVRRQITGSDAMAHTISFTPALSSPVCGRATDCRGVMVTGWATGATHANNFYLSAGSPARNAGIWVSGVHCAKADDAGGALLQDCIHWKGTAPDLGFYEFGILTAPRRAHPVTIP